jgi:hypothetical protein
MSLSEEQKAAVARWVEAGEEMGAIQNRIKTEFGLTLTYMEVRFLLDDLKVVPKSAPEPEPDAASEEPAVLDLEPEPAPGGGRVSLSIDQITKPSALISGKVTFSDGQRAEWMLDQMGRLSLNPNTPGYRPTQDDVMAFQMELQSMARRQGF